MKKLLLVLAALVFYAAPHSAFAAITFLEPGTDATFNVANTTGGGFWNIIGGTAPTSVSDFVHGTHQRSIKPSTNLISYVFTPNGVASDAGGRISMWVYFNALPTGAGESMFGLEQASDGNVVFQLNVSTAGVVGLFNGSLAQLGSNGATLTTGRWYQLSVAYTITSTSVNRMEVFVDGVPSISVTNGSLTDINSSGYFIGSASYSTTVDYRLSDIYIDDSSSLTYPGSIWVTAKRPNANGALNQFATQIGAGGSGYGSGHSPQVNERPLSTTNGWSAAAVAVTTEEYNIENRATGDININGFIILGYRGWAYASSILSETANLIVNGVSSAISLTNTATMFTANTTGSAYPAGSGTDVGISTSATVTTVSLFEAGVIVAYIPTPAFVPWQFFDF